MSNELDLRPKQAMNPLTGQLYVLAEEPTDALAGQYHEISQFVLNGARVFQRALADELLARGDSEATWTVRGGGWVVEMDGPGRTEIDDPESLYEDLMSLAEHGLLSREAVEKAVKPVTVYKPQKAGLNALRKLGGEVAEVLDRHQQPTAKPRGVRVKPA